MTEGSATTATATAAASARNLGRRRREGKPAAEERKREGKRGESRDDRGLLSFVIHKHKATSLHYDFRLEVGDVMPSWSIPKGPSLDSSVRRLAIPTTDHQLEYRHFEGVIESGYGAGPVMIWDEGTYTPEVEVAKGVRRPVSSAEEAEVVAKESLAKGNFKFLLYGKKLNGSFALVRTAGFGGGGREGGRIKAAKQSWLLIKHRDEYSREGYDANDYDFSALSGKSIAQIAGQRELSERGIGRGEDRMADQRARQTDRQTGRPTR
jgi:bifunctional non-homologous end joining protein LigD